jgi:hypothetical protein
MRHERAILKQTCKELAKMSGNALARAMWADATGDAEMAKKERDLAARLEAALRTYQVALDTVRIADGEASQIAQSAQTQTSQGAITQPSAVQPKTAVVASAPSYTMNDIIDALRDQLPATDKRPEAQQVCLAALNALQHLSSPPRFVAATSIVESFAWNAEAGPIAQVVVGWLRAKARGGARADKSE